MGYCYAHVQRLKRCGDLQVDVPIRSGKYKPVTPRPVRTPRKISGRYIKRGYVWILIRCDDFCFDLCPPSTRRESGGYALEHRVVMSRFLGRLMLPHENVHHRNGDRQDNRIENLELWVKVQPSGQRAEDLVVWAEEILALYKGKVGAS